MAQTATGAAQDIATRAQSTLVGVPWHAEYIAKPPYESTHSQDGDAGKGGSFMGYQTQAGYWGCVDGRWMLFVSESEYWEYIHQ